MERVNIEDLEAWCKIEFGSGDDTYSPLYYAHHLFLDDEEITDLVIPEGVEHLGYESFQGCWGLTSVVFPKSVKSIGEYAFSGCSCLKDIYCYAERVPSTGDYAFTGFSTSSATLHVPAGSLEAYSTTEPWSDYGTIVAIEDENTNIQFADANVKAICISNWDTNGDGELSEAEAAAVKDLGRVFNGNSSITSFEELQYFGLTCIGESAFSCCSNMISVMIPKGVRVIDYRAFEYCSSLTTITIPNSVTCIGWASFEGCIGLTSITIPNSVTSIDKYGFASCSGLTSIIIGDGMKSIDEAAFSNCSSLTDVYCYAENVPCIDYYDEYSNPFYNSPTDYATLHVPGKSLNLYRNAWPWNKFGRILPINMINSLTYIVDGEIYKTYEVEYNTPITPEPTPAKAGYTFSGWSEIPEIMPAEDVVVTGSFIPNYTLTYILDGNIYKTYTVALGSAITPEPAPTKEGYTFSGWSYIPLTMPEQDVVIIGTFTINSYALTYMIDGEEYKTSTVEYGSEITPETEPTKEGYTFSGWSEIPTTMPAGDVVVTGTFTVNSYNLTYIVDGEEYKTTSVDYGTALTPEEEPAKVGYTFSGWSEIPETMPAEDVIVTGSFIINQYLLTYVIDGEEYKSYEVDYNTALTPEPAPVRKGMTFSGWDGFPETMPAYDLTLSGTYSWSKKTVDGVIYQVSDTLSNYASVVGTEGLSEEATILHDVKIGGDLYTINSIEGDALPRTITINISFSKLLLSLWEAGYENIRETDSGRSLAAPKISLVSVTSSSLKLSYKNEYQELTETVVVSGSPIEKGENGYEVALKGLEPDCLYEGLVSLTLTYDDASYMKSFSFRTELLTLATQQPKIVSLGNVVVAANSNLDNGEKNVGFEWRRTDWTDDFASNFGAAYLYEGTMEGYIRSLNTDKLWKYRPFYESNAGNRYYGDWVGIDPTNISYFEPTVHTYATITVQGNSAEVKGYAMRGTDNVTSQGFIYWNISFSSSRRNAYGIPSDAKTVLSSGNVMSATLENLEYETEYCCVAFVTTSTGETFYGEPQTFRTGEIDPDGIRSIHNEQFTIDNDETWYDLGGRKLGSKPAKPGLYIQNGRKVLVK